MRILIIGLFLMLISCTVKREERNINTGKVFHVYEENWLTNKKHGESIHYYRNGNIDIRLQYKNGKIDGEYSSYYRNKNIKFRVEYKNDVLWNVYEYNDEEGNELDFGSFKDGNGHIIKYDSDGVMNEEGEVKNGLREGVWKYYIKGRFFYEREYKEGKEIELKNQMIVPIF